MTTQHIQTLLVLAERARQAGLIQFAEMAPVVEAVTAAQNVLKAAQEQAAEQAETPGESERRKAKH